VSVTFRIVSFSTNILMSVLFVATSARSMMMSWATLPVSPPLMVKGPDVEFDRSVVLTNIQDLTRRSVISWKPPLERVMFSVRTMAEPTAFTSAEEISKPNWVAE